MRKFCEHCGASMNEHRHTLSRAMVEGLKRLAEYDFPVNIKHLQLTRNQWDNFQKLRYWGLVRKSYNEIGVRLAGQWEVTSKGRQFLAGKIGAPKHVWTYRGEFVRSEFDLTTVSDCLPVEYKQREDYAAEALEHQP